MHEVLANALRNRSDWPDQPLATFAIRHLSVLSYAQGFTAWHYRLGGPLASAMAGDFFRDASDMLAIGDTVTVSAQDGGAILFIHQSGKGREVVVEPMCRTLPNRGAAAGQ